MGDRVTTQEHAAAMARRILDSITYMTLATADEEGRPWASPVWYARASPTEFLWVSDPEARHSRNVAHRPEVGLVVFDSTVPIGGAEAVYTEAVAEELTGADLERGLAIYARRSNEAGAREWALADVSPPARFRLYRATASAAFVLGPHDRRLAVQLGDARRERWMTGERMVEVSGVELCAQTFGNADDPAVLLVMGLAASMLHWEDEFCERLAAGSRFVIRYDHRDTGRSATYPPGAPGYTGQDLVADAAGLLDALGLSRAHVVGFSMGGAIAQRLALDHADHVASLTLISTSPGTGDDLPGMSDELRAYFADPPPEPDWCDREAVIEHLVDDERVYAARSRPFAEAERRQLAGRIFDRTTDIAASMKNHWLLAGEESWRERLGEIRVPTLVLHGTEDPLFPIGHALALTREIPGARLIRLERTGHELPRESWDVVVPEILRHTTKS